MALLILFLGVSFSLSSRNKSETELLPVDMRTQEVTLTPHPQVISYKCEEGKTAYDILDERFTIEAQDSSFGKFVTGINDVKPSQNQFWAFYVDEKIATVGATAYVCQDQEKVEWKLEEIK